MPGKRDLTTMKRNAWRIEPAQTATFAAGGDWYCPNERCGEDHLGILVPHPKDPDRTPNRCPTCLATAARNDEHGTENEG